jgi:hypothetical protein
MAKRDNATKSNQAAAKALEAARSNPVVSDFRKESETFRFLMAHRSSMNEIEDFVSVLQRDYVCGFINSDDVNTHLAPIDTAVRLKILELKLGLIRKNAGALQQPAFEGK